MARSRASSILCIVAGTLAACGGNSTPTDSSVTDTASSDTASFDAVDVARVDSPPEATVITNYLHGSINITELAIQTPTGTVFSDTEKAEFQNISASAGFTITDRVDGLCHIVHINGPMGDAGPCSGNDVSGGIVTIQGVGVPTATTLTPNADNSYTESTNNVLMRRWNGGDSIMISAAGATVPSFQTQITFPRQIDISSPTMPALGVAIAVHRAAGFVAQWNATGQASENVAIVIAQADVSACTATEILCTYPLNGGGQGSISAADLSELRPGAVDVVIGMVNNTSLNVGPYPIDISALAVSFVATGRVD